MGPCSLTTMQSPMSYRPWKSNHHFLKIGLRTTIFYRLGCIIIQKFHQLLKKWWRADFQGIPKGLGLPTKKPTAAEWKAAPQCVLGRSHSGGGSPVWRLGIRCSDEEVRIKGWLVRITCLQLPCLFGVYEGWSTYSTCTEPPGTMWWYGLMIGCFLPRRMHGLTRFNIALEVHIE